MDVALVALQQIKAAECLGAYLASGVHVWVGWPVHTVLMDAQKSGVPKVFMAIRTWEQQFFMHFLLVAGTAGVAGENQIAKLAFDLLASFVPPLYMVEVDGFGLELVARTVWTLFVVWFTFHSLFRMMIFHMQTLVDNVLATNWTQVFLPS
jgi:hypothetical protein